MIKLFAFIGIMTVLLFLTFIFSAVLALNEEKYQLMKNMEQEKWVRKWNKKHQKKR